MPTPRGAAVAVGVGTVSLPVAAILLSQMWPFSILPWVLAAPLPDGGRDVVPAVLVGLAFFVWSRQVVAGQCRLSLATLAALLTMAGGSAAWLIAGWPLGLRYQGKPAVVTLAVLDALSVVALLALWRRNRRQPTLATAMFFRVGVVLWLFSSAYGWLGEMI